MLSISRPHTLSALLTIAFSLLILPINETIAFTIPDDKKLLVISYLLKLLFACFFYLLVFFIINFINKIKNKNELYINWLKYASIYFFIMAIFFFLLYPGDWVWDEFNLLNFVKTYEPYSWQHYFTNIYFTFCLYLIPSGVSIVLFQIIFASFVVGYITSKTRSLLKNKNLAALVFIIFLLPPIILNNFYPLRLTIYSYLELILVSKLIFMHLSKSKDFHKYRELFIFSFLIMLLSFWRTEGIYYLILFPILIFWLKIFTKKNIKTFVPYLVLSLCFCIFLLGFVVTNSVSTDKQTSMQYQLTAQINPLSIMIQKELRGDDVNKRLQDIDKVLNLEILRKNPSYEEVPAFWEGVVRSGYQDNIDIYMKQYVYLVIHNPNSFLDARLKTFMSTNSFGKTLPFVNSGRFNLETYASGAQQPKVEKFFASNYFSQPIDFNIKQITTRKLIFLNDNGKFSFWGHVFWNVIPVIILLVLIGLRELFTKQFFLAFIFSLVLFRAVLLFITAPANYFMYYLPVYITGCFLIILIFTLYIDNSKSKMINKITNLLRGLKMYNRIQWFKKGKSIK